MNCLAVIPARGGSKGIPRKNLALIAGRPLVAHTIEHAKAASEIDRVVVSTEDETIARVAREADAEVVMRPTELSGDTATSESALLHVLDVLEARDRYVPDLVVFLQATSPLRRPGDVSGAIATLLAEHADSLFSGCPVHGFVWRRDAAGVSSVTYDFRARPRRQEAAEHLVENGSIYVFRPWVLRQFGNRLGGRIAVYRMAPEHSFQIDEPGDLGLLERLLATAKAPDGAEPTTDGLIELLVLDFDGVLTDNRVMVDEDGRETVACHRGDGWGLARLKEAGPPVVVLSLETNRVVAARCQKLGIEYVQSCTDKLTTLRQLASDRGVAPARIAYVGNDVNDLPVMRWVGLPIAVADAVPEARTAAHWVTAAPGGWGAVREVTDRLIAARERASRAADGSSSPSTEG